MLPESLPWGRIPWSTTDISRYYVGPSTPCHLACLAYPVAKVPLKIPGHNYYFHVVLQPISGQLALLSLLTADDRPKIRSKRSASLIKEQKALPAYCGSSFLGLDSQPRRGMMPPPHFMPVIDHGFACCTLQAPPERVRIAHFKSALMSCRPPSQGRRSLRTLPN